MIRHDNVRVVQSRICYCSICKCYLTASLNTCHCRCNHISSGNLSASLALSLPAAEDDAEAVFWYRVDNITRRWMRCVWNSTRRSCLFKHCSINTQRRRSRYWSMSIYHHLLIVNHSASIRASYACITSSALCNTNQTGNSSVGRDVDAQQPVSRCGMWAVEGGGVGELTDAYGPWVHGWPVSAVAALRSVLRLQCIITERREESFDLRWCHCVSTSPSCGPAARQGHVLGVNGSQQ